MARGWESKSVESQQDDRARTRDAHHVPPSAAERERAEKRAALLLQRSRVLDELSRTTAAARRASLEQAVAHLDAALRALESA